MADIPAPSTGAGIGYGVQSATTRTSSSSSSHALSAASIAAEARNAMTGRSSSQQQHHTSMSRLNNFGVTVEDVHSSGGSSRASGSVRSHSSSSTVDVQQRAHHPKTAGSKAVTRTTSKDAHEPADDGVSIGSDSIANIAGDMRNYESSDSELSNHPLDDVRAHVASAHRNSSSSRRTTNSGGDSASPSPPPSTHWDHPAMDYDQLGATMKRGQSASRSVWRDEDEDGDALPPSLSLTATLGSNAVKGGARYGTSGSGSSTMISGATQTLGNASATLRTSSSSQNRNSGELKKLADESLRNLQETRSLNRTEEAEESQQEQVRQMVRDKQQTAGRATTSSTTTTTTRTTTQQQSQSSRGQQQQQQNVRGTSTSRSRGVPPRSALDDLDVTVDSDSALWAFEASGDFH